MTEDLYTIEEFCTVGWTPIASKLTKPQATERIESLINEGYNPNRLRVIREQ